MRIRRVGDGEVSVGDIVDVPCRDDVTTFRATVVGVNGKYATVRYDNGMRQTVFKCDLILVSNG